jgi:hypothetical protein
MSNVIEHPAQHANNWLKGVAEDLDSMFRIGLPRAQRLARQAAFVNDDEMLRAIARIHGICDDRHIAEFVDYWTYSESDG